MIWGYAGAASLEEAGLHPLRRRSPGLSRRAAPRPGVTRILPAARRSASGRSPSSTSASSGIRGPAVTAATSLAASSSRAAGMSESQTWATVVKTSTSRRIIGVRSSSRGGAVQADEQHPSSAPRAGDRRRRRVRRAARLDHDVEADAVAELEQQLGEISAGGVRGLVRAERRRGGQPLVVDVDRDDLALGRAARGARDDERADPAGSDHRDGIVRALRDARERVEGDGQRLRHRRRVVVARVGDGAADRAPATSRTRPARRRPEARACGTRRTGSSGRRDTSGSGRTRSRRPRRLGRRRAGP